MEEEYFDFDEVVERKNTDSLKYDFAMKRGKPEGVLPLWVADMDFRTSPRVLEAIEARVRHGIFGYTESGDRYFEAVAGWMKERHQWTVQRDWLVKTPGVVFAIAMAIRAFSREGDGILIQQPVYYPFAEVIRDNNRKVINNSLVQDVDGKYRIDFEDFERKIREYRVPLFILCSPHNPVGRVWTKEELARLGEICLKYHVIVVSDEIHEDFVFGDRKHLVFANMRKEFEKICVVCTSPTKTFNIAGLQVSNIFIPDEGLRQLFQKQIDAAGYSQMNTIGLVACESAYLYGGNWYDAMMKYIAGNISFLKMYVERELPELKVTEPEGTYLVWVDFRGLGLTEQGLEELIAGKAGLWLDSGAVFGEIGAGFQRFNVACPRIVLKRAMEQLKRAIREGHSRA